MEVALGYVALKEEVEEHVAHTINKAAMHPVMHVSFHWVNDAIKSPAQKQCMGMVCHPQGLLELPPWLWLHCACNSFQIPGSCSDISACVLDKVTLFDGPAAKQPGATIIAYMCLFSEQVLAHQAELSSSITPGSHTLLCAPPS